VKQHSDAVKSPRFDKHRSTSEAASQVMRRNRGRDTRPELLLRRTLWRRGVRYRLHVKELPGKPDLVFKRTKVAVFCDGDFWHGRDWPRRRARLLRGSNSDYWIAKIETSMKRDALQTQALKKAGWFVLRLWEGDIARDPEGAAAKVEKAVLKRRGLT
jgi:DNA mismatch endonuclease (patch repair protein)